MSGHADVGLTELRSLSVAVVMMMVFRMGMYSPIVTL